MAKRKTPEALDALDTALDNWKETYRESAGEEVDDAS